MNKPNWPEIARTYIEGEISATGERTFPILEDLSKKYGVRPGTLRRHSAEEHWRDKRATFQSDLEERARQLRLEKRAKEELDFHDNCLKISRGGIFHLADHLNKMLDDFKAWKDDPWDEVEKGGKKVRVKKKPPLDKGTIGMLEAISRTLERLQKAGCVALGIPDRNTTVSGPMGAPLEVMHHLSPEELDRRIQDQYALLGYEVPPGCFNGCQKTSLNEARDKLAKGEIKEDLSEK